MSALRLWVRADLRRRWRAWLVLGVLAGAVIGLAAAAAAGARRTGVIVPRYARAADAPDAGVFPNSPAFTARVRDRLARLPEVERAIPFAVLFGVGIEHHPDWVGLAPVDPSGNRGLNGPVIDGRLPDPRRPDEGTVTEATRRRFHVGIGDTLTVVASITPGALPPAMLPPHVDYHFRVTSHIVGIQKDPQGGVGWSPSPGFYAEYHDRIAAFVNVFLDLRHGAADIPAFSAGVTKVMGHPVDVVNLAAQVDQKRSSTDLEERGLWLFALAVLLGGGALAGQALVRSVTARAGEADVWRDLGADRATLVAALVVPSALAALAAGIVSVVVAVALSPRFPIGTARAYDLDAGVHVDFVVLVPTLVFALVAVTGVALLAAALRVTRGEHSAVRASTVGGWAARMGLPPAPAIGSRLALEPGRGRRAVPVRSAIAAAIAGVLGVVACFTFRAGLSDAVSRPERTGVVWQYYVYDATGTLPHATVARVVAEPTVGAALDAVWLRNATIDRIGVPAWVVRRLKGSMPFVLLSGRAPRTPAEIALAPTTMRRLHAHVGGLVSLGSGSARARVVGEALLPSSPHSSYDEGAWATRGATQRLLVGGARAAGPDDVQEAVLIRWASPHAAGAGEKRLHTLVPPDGGLGQGRATVDPNVAELERLRTLPLVLGVFLAFLAVASLAHALVTTVSRRRHELAVLRALGFTRRQARLAIAWQASLLAAIGLCVGIPLGLVVGRAVWRSLAVNFPFVYVPPLALAAVLLVIPAALLVANLLAAAPSRRAARLQPARILRAE
ncbi:MAG: FtsX-like permease family protein [Acidimicrobiia bacterium]